MMGGSGKAPPRIWHQSVNELDHFAVYKQALEAHAAEILGDDAKVIVHGLPSGSYGGASATAVLGNAYSYYRILGQVIDNAIAAERQGYDAFVIGSFSEPFELVVAYARLALNDRRLGWIGSHGSPEHLGQHEETSDVAARAACKSSPLRTRRMALRMSG